METILISTATLWCVTTTITVVTVTSDIVTPKILVCWGYINKTLCWKNKAIFSVQMLKPSANVLLPFSWFVSTHSKIFVSFSFSKWFLNQDWPHILFSKIIFLHLRSHQIHLECPFYSDILKMFKHIFPLVLFWLVFSPVKCIFLDQRRIIFSLPIITISLHSI